VCVYQGCLLTPKSSCAGSQNVECEIRSTFRDIASHQNTGKSRPYDVTCFCSRTSDMQTQDEIGSAGTKRSNVPIPSRRGKNSARKTRKRTLLERQRDQRSVTKHYQEQNDFAGEQCRSNTGDPLSLSSKWNRYLVVDPPSKCIVGLTLAESSNFKFPQRKTYHKHDHSSLAQWCVVHDDINRQK